MRYEITLNGKVYEVEVQDNRALLGAIGAAAPLPEPTPGSRMLTPARGVAMAPPPPAPPRPAAPAMPKGEPLPAPMPGTVREVRVKVGQAVRANQPLVILEAMKMENEIVAPTNAIVTEILVAKGQNVGAGAPLLRLAKAR